MRWYPNFQLYILYSVKFGIKSFTRCGLCQDTISTYKLSIYVKAAYSVTMNIFSNFFYFLLKSFVKVELSCDFTIKMVSTAENCTEK